VEIRLEPTGAAFEILVAVFFQNFDEPVDEAASVGLAQSFAMATPSIPADRLDRFLCGNLKN